MARTYLCDHRGNVICKNGWKKSTVEHKNHFNPCPEPICNHGCENGECKGYSIYIRRVSS